MFIKYILKEQILIVATAYTVNAEKSVRDAVFFKYLFKIVKIPGINNSKSAQALCIVDNIILRKTAEMKVKILVEIVVLRLIPDEFYEGIVTKSSSKGIIVSFLSGLLEATLPFENMHKDTIYREQKNEWILTNDNASTQGYSWKIGSEVRFRIVNTFWDKQLFGVEQQNIQMSDLIIVKANQAGLGPVQWWI